MNRRTLRIGAVVCSAGVVIGGITLATNASAAPAALALNSGGSSFTVANLGTATDGAANTAYALKLTDSTAATKIDVESSPTTGALVSYQVKASNAANTSAGTATLTAAATPVALSSAPVPATSNVYLTGDVPGDYVIRLFEDTNGNGQVDAADERASAPITMKVYDAVNATAGVTGDDVAPVISTATPIDIGRAITPDITYNKSLTLADARGGATSATGLSAALAALTAVDVSSEDAAVGVGTVNGVANATDQAVTHSTTTGLNTYSVGTPTETGVVTVRADLKPTLGTTDGTLSSQFASKTVTVSTNGIVTLTNAVTKDKDHLTASGATTIRAGVATTTFTTLAVDGAGTPAPVAGKTVVFTLTTGTNAPVLSVGGATVASGGTVTAVTDSAGKASITVTSSKTTDLTSYTVAANSNAVTTSSVVATYAAVTGVVSIDPTLSAMIGGSVVVKGSLKDQFEQKLTPGAGVQAVLTVDRPSPAADFTQTVDITDGAFSVTVPDVASNTTARQDAFAFTFTGGFTATTPAGTGAINWLTSVAPDSVTLNSLTTQSLTDVPGTQITTFPAAAGTKLDILDVTKPVNATNSNPEHLAAVVKNAAGDPLPGVDFTVSGTGGGVYFLDADGKAVTSYSGKTNAAGLIYDGSVRPYVLAFFTAPGAHTLTVTAGAKSATTGTLTVEDATVPQTVDLAPTVGLTDKNVVIKGKVLDAFGNGVADQNVNLSLASSAVGSILDSTVSSDASGNFSAILLSGSDTGTTTVKAVAPGITNTAAAAYGVTGLTIPAAVDTDTAALQIVAGGVEIMAPERRTGPGDVTVSGVAQPGKTVSVFTRPINTNGSYTKVKVVIADAQGAWSTKLSIKAGVSVYATSGSDKSDPVDVAMTSKLMANAVPVGKGVVKVSIAGYPAADGAGIALYEVKSNGSLVKIGATLHTDSRGVAKITWKTTKGTKTIKAIYKAPGTNQGSVFKTFTVN